MTDAVTVYIPPGLFWDTRPPEPEVHSLTSLIWNLAQISLGNAPIFTDFSEEYVYREGPGLLNCLRRSFNGNTRTAILRSYKALGINLACNSDSQILRRDIQVYKNGLRNLCTGKQENMVIRSKEFRAAEKHIIQWGGQLSLLLSDPESIDKIKRLFQKYLIDVEVTFSDSLSEINTEVYKLYTIAQVTGLIGSCPPYQELCCLAREDCEFEGTSEVRKWMNRLRSQNKYLRVNEVLEALKHFIDLIQTDLHRDASYMRLIFALIKKDDGVETAYFLGSDPRSLAIQSGISEENPSFQEYRLEPTIHHFGGHSRIFRISGDDTSVLVLPHNLFVLAYEQAKQDSEQGVPLLECAKISHLALQGNYAMVKRLEHSLNEETWKLKSPTLQGLFSFVKIYQKAKKTPRDLNPQQFFFNQEGSICTYGPVDCHDSFDEAAFEALIHQLTSSQPRVYIQLMTSLKFSSLNEFYAAVKLKAVEEDQDFKLSSFSKRTYTAAKNETAMKRAEELKHQIRERKTAILKEVKTCYQAKNDHDLLEMTKKILLTDCENSKNSSGLLASLTSQCTEVARNNKLRLKPEVLASKKAELERTHENFGNLDDEIFTSAGIYNSEDIQSLF
jgi:hypothetical protein